MMLLFFGLFIFDVEDGPWQRHILLKHVGDERFILVRDRVVLLRLSLLIAGEKRGRFGPPVSSEEHFFTFEGHFIIGGATFILIE